MIILWLYLFLKLASFPPAFVFIICLTVISMGNGHKTKKAGTELPESFYDLSERRQAIIKSSFVSLERVIFERLKGTHLRDDAQKQKIYLRRLRSRYVDFYDNISYDRFYSVFQDCLRFSSSTAYVDIAALDRVYRSGQLQRPIRRRTPAKPPPTPTIKPSLPKTQTKPKAPATQLVREMQASLNRDVVPTPKKPPASKPEKSKEKREVEERTVYYFSLSVQRPLSADERKASETSSHAKSMEFTVAVAGPLPDELKKRKWWNGKEVLDLLSKLPVLYVEPKDITDRESLDVSTSDVNKPAEGILGMLGQFLAKRKEEGERALEYTISLAFKTSKPYPGSREAARANMAKEARSAASDVRKAAARAPVKRPSQAPVVLKPEPGQKVTKPQVTVEKPTVYIVTAHDFKGPSAAYRVTLASPLGDEERLRDRIRAGKDIIMVQPLNARNKPVPPAQKENETREKAQKRQSEEATLLLLDVYKRDESHDPNIYISETSIAKK